MRDLSHRFPQVYRGLLRSNSAKLVLGRTRSLVPGDFAIELPNGFSVVRSDQVNEQAETFWLPPRRLLMDRAKQMVRRSDFVASLVDTDAAGTGRGVVVGIADSGADLTHPDLRDAAGNTRVAWMIDLSSSALGFYPELEQSFGCSDAEVRCAVLGQPEIDVLIAEGQLAAPSGVTTRLPRDLLGHGTHVATIAAGGGMQDVLYTGMAPEATLVIAQIASAEQTVNDAAVALATRFIYDRADALGMPSVVNLSLGGDLGPHDGKSVLGDVLRGFLDQPGRAMVVAAGNSGRVIEEQVDAAEEGPFGIHTRVQFSGTTHVPVLMPRDMGDADGSIFVWVATPSGDDLAIGLEDETGAELIAPVGPDAADSTSGDRLSVTVVNQFRELAATVSDIERGAVVAVEGRFKAGEKLLLRLEGNATVNLWVQSDGAFGPSAGSIGALFPNARRAGTITSPADTVELIAVGATLNRLDWPARSGDLTELEPFDPTLDLQVGSAMYFSSLGPTTRGGMKPDIFAPGGPVVAGLSRSADPRLGTGLSLFATSPLCSTSSECAVVSDAYAAGIGTSMASPLVAGAIALLLEQDRSLTQAQLLRLVQASAGRLPEGGGSVSQAIGALDLPRAVDALHRLATVSSVPEVASSEASWLSLSDDVALLGSAKRLEGVAHLRTFAGEIADPPASDLTLKVSNGEVLTPLERQAPGLYTFAVGAKSADSKLSVRLNYAGATLLRTEVKTSATIVNLPPDEGGCSVRPRRGSPSSATWPLGLLSAALWMGFCRARKRVA